jgi:hypothetical protein
VENTKNLSVRLLIRIRCIRVAAWSGVGLVAAAFTPVAALAAGQPLEIQIAYLDPGTGSLILQALVATLAGAIVAVTAYWQKIKSLFRRSSRGSEPSDTPPSDD